MLRVKSDDITEFISSSLYYCSIDSSDLAHLKTAIDCYSNLASQGISHMPFYLVFDLTCILKNKFHIKFKSDQEIELWPDDEKGIRLKYERDLLSRLAYIPNFSECMEMLDDGPLSELRVQRLVGIIIKFLSDSIPHHVNIAPGVLRSLKISDELKDLNDQNPYNQVHRESLISLVQYVSDKLKPSKLISQQDVFELRHIHQLNNDHLRIGCRQLLELKSALKSIEVDRLTINDHEDERETKFVDETIYPSGGIAGLTNKGPFENLVLSELMYLEEEHAGTNLFDLRYLESELLFYLRDSGILRRKRRSVHFIFNLGSRFEMKIASLPWQYSVLIQGLCLRIIDDMSKIFENDSLNFHIHYITKNNGKFIEGEIEIMQLILEDFIKNKRLKISRSEELKLKSICSEKHKDYALIFNGEETRQWEEEHEVLLKKGFQLEFIQIGLSEESKLSLPKSDLDSHALTDIKEGLLEQLLA